MGWCLPAGVRGDRPQQLRVRYWGAERAEAGADGRQSGARAGRRRRAHAARAAWQQDRLRPLETGQLLLTNRPSR